MWRESLAEGIGFKYVLNQKFPNTMYDVVSGINTVCMFLTNFDLPLVQY